MKNFVRKSAFVAAAGAAVVALWAGVASAHVTVNPSEATQGGFTKLTFRVPNEMDKPTTKVEVALPADQPLGFVSTKPVAGWKTEVVKAKLAKPIKTDDGEVTEAVSRITWTATAGGIQPGEFQEFDISAGPLPEADKMVFKALQTYAGGEVVRWIDEQTGDTEPEHPAPVLNLVKGEGGDHHDAPAPHGAATDAKADGHTDHEMESGSAAIGLGVAGLVAGLGGLILGALAFARTRRSS